VLYIYIYIYIYMARPSIGLCLAESVCTGLSKERQAVTTHSNILSIIS